MISVEHMQELIDKFNNGELDIRDIIEQSYFGGKSDVINDFLKRDKECQQESKECPYMYSEIGCVECIARQLKEQKND